MFLTECRPTSAPEQLLAGAQALTCHCNSGEYEIHERIPQKQGMHSLFMRVARTGYIFHIQCVSLAQAELEFVN